MKAAAALPSVNTYASSASITPSYGGRWDVYSGYSRSGYVKGGPAAAAAGAALLLL